MQVSMILLISPAYLATGSALSLQLILSLLSLHLENKVFSFGLAFYESHFAGQKEGLI